MIFSFQNPRFQFESPQLLTFIIIVSQLIYFLLIHHFAFNYEILFNRHYFYIGLFSCSIVVYFFTCLLSSRQKIKDVLFGSAIAIILYLSLINIANEYLVILLSTLIDVLLVLSLDFKLFQFIFRLGSLLLVAEAFIGLTQLTRGNLPTGTFNNSGVFAITLLSQMPYFAYLTFLFKERIRTHKKVNLYLILYIVGIIISSLTIFLIIKCKSRTAIGTLFLVLFIYIIETRKVIAAVLNLTVRAVLVYVFCFTGILSAGLLTYFLSFKKASMRGRILLIKIAWKHVTDNFWFGCGLNRFTWLYPQWQAEYFRRATISADLKTSAGESYMIFNEYLQLFESVGCIIFLCLISLIIPCIFLKKSSNSHFLNAIKYTCIVLLISAFSFYTFHVNYLLLYFLLCIVLILRIRYPFWNAKIHIPLAWYFQIPKSIIVTANSLILTSAIVIMIHIYFVDTAVFKWQSLKSNIVSDENAKAIYRGIYPKLKDDPKFLCDYGDFLSNDPSSASTGLRFLDKARESFLSKKLLEASARAYWDLKRYDQAIKNYDFESYFLPNLIGPKVCIIKILLEEEKFKDAKDIAESILKNKPKINSIQTQQMREYARKIVTEFNNNEKLN